MTTQAPEAVVHSAQGGDSSNFQPVCAYSGYDFAYCKATEGTTFTDHTFAANFHNAGSLTARGAYHFYHPAFSAIDQAHFFWSVVSAQSLKPGDFLVADIEIMVGADGSWVITPGGAMRSNLLESLNAGVPPAHAGVLTSGARIFLDTLASLAGPQHPVLVYTNLSVGAQLTSCTGYDLIIAYPSLTPPGSVWPWPGWRMWQWGAGNGPCGGDSDAYNGTVADLQAWQAKYMPHPPPPPPPHLGQLASKTGDDEMFYLPKGKDAAVVIGIPPFVPGSSSVVPTGLYLSSNGSAQFLWEQGVNSQQFQPFNVDYDRSPQEFSLSQLAPGQRAVQFVRQDEGVNEVTGFWA